MLLKHGHQLGNYRIDRSLAMGGMGQVYAAEDPRLGRQVAIKVLPVAMATHEARVRFEREARAVASLSHPNILVIHDIGSQPDLLYIVTELLEGSTLRSVLESHGTEGLPWPRAVEIGNAVAAGLAAAHANQIIHRDLKPENIFITTNQQTKILDFGLARIADDERERRRSTARRTPTGQLMGTSGYMSPEQVSSSDLDGRSDVFALGCVLYEMLSGKKAFGEKNLVAAIRSILSDDPPELADANDRLPSELCTVVHQCLFKDRTERVQSAGELATKLRELTTEISRTVPVTRPSFSSIVVLPLTPGPQCRKSEGLYLCDGLAESVIRILSQTSELRIIAWSTAARFRNRHLEAARVGRELGVDAVLEGELEVTEPDLVVRATLIDSRTGSTLWSKRYDRPADDLVAVQNSIAARISAHLGRVDFDVAPSAPAAAITTPPAKKSPDPAAYRLYLRGRFHLNRRVREGVERSRECFLEAIRVDPDIALAWAGLADSYNVAPFWGLSPPLDAFPEARVAATKALRIDPLLAEAHASLAYLRFYFDWDWPGSRQAFQQALDLQPGHASGHHWFGIAHALRGDFDSAQQHLECALDLDPLSLMLNADQALVSYWRLESEQAIRHCRSTLELDVHFAPAHYYLALALELGGALDQAADCFHTALEIAGPSTALRAALAHCFAMQGQHRDARKELELLDDHQGTTYVSAYAVALVHEALGDRAAALASLERAERERAPMLVWLPIDPRFRSLREDPRAAPFLAQLE